MERRFKELDDLVLQLKGFVLVRDLLRRRGATDGEIRAHDAEIVRVRTLLAETVKGGGGALGAAA